MVLSLSYQRMAENDPAWSQEEPVFAFACFATAGATHGGKPQVMG